MEVSQLFLRLRVPFYCSIIVERFWRGSGYDDDLMAVDWDYMPIVRVLLDDSTQIPVGN